MATLHLRNGVYYIGYRIDGTRHRVSTGTSDEKAALAVLQEIEAELANVKLRRVRPGFSNSPDIKAPADFADAVSSFTDYAVTRDLTPKTISGYLERLQLFGVFLDQHSLDYRELAARHIRAYIRYSQERGLQSISINGYLKVIRLFYRYLIEDGLLNSNPAESVKLLRVPRDIKVPLTREQIRKLFKACWNRQYSPENKRFYRIRNVCAIMMLYDCALRIGELTRIKIDDVDFEKHTVMINGKGRKQRIVIFSQKTAQMMQELMKLRHKLPGDTLVCAADGSPLEINYLQMLMKRLSKTLGFHVNPHLLRHTGATHRAAAGMPVFALQAMLGHENITTTMKYVNLANQKELNATYLEFSPLAEHKAGAQTEQEDDKE